MKSRALPIKVGVAAAAIAVSAAACGSNSSGGGTAAGDNSNQPTAASADATATQAAELRTGLDTLFREHVDLTGFTVQTAAISGIGSTQTAAALKTLDSNTVALADAIGSIYGPAARDAFLKMWRAHIGFFVNYTKGLASHDKHLVSQSQSQLAGYKRDFATFLAGATQIPANAIATELQGHIQTLESAIKAILTGSKTAGAKLEMAAEHMDGTAQALASGIAKEKGLTGNADGDAAGLRAALTGLLIQHVAQTGAVIQSLVATGSLSSPQTTGAISALDQNTVDLGKAIGSLYGGDAQQAFLKMWRAHIGFFVTYTEGIAGNDAAKVRQAKHQLAGYQKQFGDFLGSATGLPGSAVSADLQGHVQTLEAAIKAILAKSPSASTKIAMAESHMAGTAQVLAKAIAAQKDLS
ncbi:MAG TPA: hypothetical protein VHA79_03725 [Mycobacteriales bacterium]|jgi:hypothetical protein|nr:hypothetical protein [Mycobacteriales bacterium]